MGKRAPLGQPHPAQRKRRPSGGGDTKTYAGTRTILLPTSTAERLRLRKKPPYSPWIFHDPLRPEAPLNPGTAYRQLKKSCRRPNCLNSDSTI